MDNLTHTLFGAALAKTRLGQRSPLAGAALVICSNLPDIDILSSLWEKPAYLLYHRGITHSFVGIALQAVLMTGILLAIEKRFFSDRYHFRNSLSSLLLASLSGLTGHLLFDFFNIYGVRPWLPFSESWIYGDILFIVDPYVWLLLAGMAFVPRPHAKWGHFAFALFVFGSEWIVATHARSPQFLKVLYPLLLLLLVLGRWKWGKAKSVDSLLLTGAVLFLLYLGTLFLLRETVRGQIESMGIESNPELVLVGPTPADPFTWIFIGQTHGEFVSGTNEFGQFPMSLRRTAKNLFEERVQRALATPRAQDWRRFARFPFAVVEENAGRTTVHLMDIRFQQQAPAGWSGISVEF